MMFHSPLIIARTRNLNDDIESASVRSRRLSLHIGKAIPDVRIGHEAYGTLSREKDNAILVCNFFSGSARAAGPKDGSHPLPGWWDAAIGAGKVLDTVRYFVVAANTLTDLNAVEGHSVTTGPARLNPATGKVYGTDFPLVTVSDFVRV